MFHSFGVCGGVRHHDGEGTFYHLPTLMASTRSKADQQRISYVPQVNAVIQPQSNLPDDPEKMVTGTAHV